MKAYNIEWDCPKSVIGDLPTEIEIPSEILEDCEDEDEINDAISDYISDETGFCHYGFLITE